MWLRGDGDSPPGPTVRPAAPPTEAQPNSAKFFKIRSPSDWLFSGWNCVA